MNLIFFFFFFTIIILPQPVSKQNTENVHEKSPGFAGRSELELNIIFCLRFRHLLNTAPYHRPLEDMGHI